MSGIASHALKLAEFAVANHALVTGVDEGIPAPSPNPLAQQQIHNNPEPVGGPKVWGMK